MASRILLLVCICALLGVMFGTADGSYFIRRKRQYSAVGLHFSNALRVCSQDSDIPTAITTANGRFYTACANQENVIHVFDTSTLSSLPDIPLGDKTPQQNPVLDLAGSDVTNFLYVLLQALTQNVLRVNLTDYTVTVFSSQINFQPSQITSFGLTGNVVMILTSLTGNTLLVYNAAGVYINNITLSAKIVQPTEAFETINGTYLIAQDSSTSSPNVLTQIDVTGKTISTYSGILTPVAGDNLTWAVTTPGFIMQDLLGQIFLVDVTDSIVVAVSSDLTAGRVLVRGGIGDPNKFVYKTIRGAVYDRMNKFMFVSHYGDPTDNIISVFGVTYASSSYF